MAELKYKEKKCFIVKDCDLDDFINAEYKPKPQFECVPEQEWSNGQSHQFDIKKEEMSESDLKSLEKRIKGEGYGWTTRYFLQDAVNAVQFQKANM